MTIESQTLARSTRVSPPLTENQYSVTAIPRKIYDEFSQARGISEEHISGSSRWRELRIDGNTNPQIKVCMLYTEEQDGEATYTKFALITWIPFHTDYRHLFEFEIKGEVSSEGRSDSKGNKLFKEVLTFDFHETNDSKMVEHPITWYIAMALRKARVLHSKPNVVSQQFIDCSVY